MNTIENILNSFKCFHIDTDSLSEAYKIIIEKKYDIVSFYGKLYLKPGNTTLITKDFISDIQSSVPIYYVIDETEFLITKGTKLLTFLSPYNIIQLRNKTDMEQVITFKRWLLKSDHGLMNMPIQEGDQYYLYGEVHNLE